MDIGVLGGGKVRRELFGKAKLLSVVLLDDPRRIRVRVSRIRHVSDEGLEEGLGKRMPFSPAMNEVSG